MKNGTTPTPAEDRPYVLGDPELGVLSRDVPTRREACAATIDREWKAAIKYLSNAVGGAEHVAAVNRAFDVTQKVCTSLHSGCPCCFKTPGSEVKKAAD